MKYVLTSLLSLLTLASFSQDKTALFSEKEASEKINTVYQRIVKGDDFCILAKIFSDNAADNCGESTEQVSKLDKSFYEELAKLKPGQVSQPFKASHGYHIVQVNNISGQTASYKEIVILYSN